MDSVVEVRVKRLVLVENHGQQFLQLQEARTPEGGRARILSMVIGPGEAQGISRCLQGVRTERPLTHELLARVLDTMGGRLRQAVIHDLRDATYFAELHIERDGETLRVDCRPSDAVALSLRLQAPVFAAERLLTAPPEED